MITHSSHPHVQSNKGIVTSDHPEWYDPKVNPPPRGVDMLCLQATGTLVKSPWIDGIGFIAWYPLPSLPQWAKAARYTAYFKNVPGDTPLGLETIKDDRLYGGSDDPAEPSAGS